MTETCPLCGAAVQVEVDEEGTCSYRPVALVEQDVVRDPGSHDVSLERRDA